MQDPATHQDTDTQKYRCSLVKIQSNYNKEKNKQQNTCKKCKQATPYDGL